ncbi:cation:proton antiporter family protein [Congregibacter litoralis]|uniref:Transporter, CPA2 family n=1 Tax=Congregibacter litoralis KT71 TaxID=314285 RepID=A4A6C4_9GAMM|nr:cation:proton antiporter family protein [Congregibacter litoralis]EAQ98571.1 transporter, CPA2 family [Congregibacter litoralis KT71]
MPDPLLIIVALACGMASRAIGMPALIGYLAAGFVLHELHVDGGEMLAVLSEMGITLLLFSIGLKLQIRDLLQPRIWGTTVIHMLVTQLVVLAILSLAAQFLPQLGLSMNAKLVIAFAFSFSSTVFVIQIMQERGEMASRHANLAVGVLIIQDLAAVLFLAASTGKMPELSALWLLLLFPARRPILSMLRLAGHGELFTLAGFALAILGAQLFDSVGIKGDLGALLIGVLLAGEQKGKELARNLLYFKDLFLVGFFLSIGLSGWPSPSLMILALILGSLALLKPLLYFPLFTRFHVAPRTALLASNSLANHSEFGLIVIAVAASQGWIGGEWSGAMSIAIAMSFIAASPLNRLSHSLYRRHRTRLLRHESPLVRASQPDTRDVRVLVLGMGNIGTGAYEAIARSYGREVLGIDDNDRKLAQHIAMHRRVAAADASDPDFWHRVDLDELELVMLALTNHQENLLVAGILREMGFTGRIAAVVRFDEEASALEAKGISAFNLYAQAGEGFAAHAAKGLRERRQDERDDDESTPSTA